MAGMNDLAKRVKELEEQLVICIRCGMCQSVCPLFAETRREADVARGKLALLDGLMKNMFQDPEGVNQRLNKCLLCGSCAANCPSGVNAVEIFIRARAILTEYSGLSPVKKAVFKKMLAKPELFDRVVEWAGKFQNIFIRDNKNVQGTSCARLISPLIAGRHFVPVAKQPLHKRKPRLNTPPGKSGLKVALFTGCLVDKFFPSIGEATLEVLDHYGVGVFLAEGQGCCGIPALASGDTGTFESLVEHNMDLVGNEKVDYLITACATCTSTIRKLWPSIYGDSGKIPREMIRKLSEKTLDINQFLVNSISLEILPGQSDAPMEQVTYHDPCHLKKSLGVFREPREVIRASGKELVEMDSPDKCCGMGGSFNIYHYDISASIGNLKQEAITSTGCTTVATGCPACMMQISDMLSQKHAGVRVKHPVELYAEALKQTL